MRGRVMAGAIGLLMFALTVGTISPGAEYTPRGGAPREAGGQEGEASPGGLGLAFVTYQSGDTLFWSEDTGDWSALATNLSLGEGDRLWAGDDSRIEVRFAGDATAWVSFRSEMDITRMAGSPGQDTIQLSLATGEGSFDVSNEDLADSVFQVDIPRVSVRVRGAARFRVNTLPDGSAQIGVISGTVDLETRDGMISVRGGEMADIREDGSVQMDFLPPADDWDSWVQSRADDYDRPAASARYLPPDLFAYAHEFDRSGRWVEYPAYGWIWVPVVPAGWSPYSNGRWVWMAGDYVWVSYDPWYAPFHYGRWNWTLSLGWFWVAPKVRAWWAPGYVAWAVTGDLVGWVPLAPEEVYYGYGYHGPASVDIHSTTVVNITNVYVNAKVGNGVVVVRKDRFLHGDDARLKVVEKENPFLGQASKQQGMVLGRPPVKEIPPILETRLPRPQAAAGKGSRPPKRVEKERADVMGRPVARGRDGSAFQPQRQPRPIRNVEKPPELDSVPPVQHKPRREPRVQQQPQKQDKQPAPVQAQPTPKQPAAPQGAGREERPVGKRAFRRVGEPAEEGGSLLPGQTGAPGEQPAEGAPRKEKRGKAQEE